MSEIDDFEPKQDQNLSITERNLRTRLDSEWISAVALREVLGIAQKNTPTFDETLNIASIIAPNLFSAGSVLLNANESIIIKRLRQKAVALSYQRNEEISVFQALDEEINEYIKLLQQPGDNTEYLKSHYDSLLKAQKRLKRDKYSETQSILRDISSLGNKLPITDEGKGYKDFQVTEDRGLRLRMLHPDSWEHVLGADVIYETHWQARELVRIIAIQYKMWEGKKLYESQVKNLNDQLMKLQKHFCNSGYCKNRDVSPSKDSYRLPCCSVFLRLTDKIQNVEYQHQTSSFHTPICSVSKLWTLTSGKNRVLESKMIRSQSLSQKSFEELFNIGMLGSDWFSYRELEQLYNETDILSNNRQNIHIHAQEFGL